MIRIGSGFDVHAFTEGDGLMMGGVFIAHSHALLAHSDGDVLLHALCDALLGALALGDIGVHFPPSEARWQGARSTDLLAHCVQLVSTNGYQIGNVDSTIICQLPKMNPHIPAMRALLASILQIDCSHISIKATTTEQLGFTGRGEGIAAQAVVLLSRR